jgi:spore germination protein KA
MATEDYYQRFTASWFIRLVRAIAFLVALALPSVYVAITTYHQEMLPTPLVLSIAAQREGVPFPAAIEALTMIFFLEVLLEGGVRLPTAVGSAISIVGALILGQAAVEAGLFSAAMVIIVALTAIASFTIPLFSLTNTVRILRILLTMISGFLGLFGVAAALFGLLIHLTAMRSFGIPYFEPLAPVVLPDLKDAITRAPWWAMKQRPELIAHENVVRIGDDQKPTPPSRGKKPTPSNSGENSTPPDSGQKPSSRSRDQKAASRTADQEAASPGPGQEPNPPSPDQKVALSSAGQEPAPPSRRRKPNPPGPGGQQRSSRRNSRR